jgi:hypothetical protein
MEVAGMKYAVALRKAVLKVLADNMTAGYVGSETLLGKVGVDKDTLDKQILYLEGKGYVRLLRELGSTFVAAEITADGIDYLEQDAGIKEPQQRIETHFHGEVKGPVHTGSGDIRIDQLTYGADEQTLAQLQADLIARLDAAQYQVVTAIVTQLRADKLQELQVLLASLEQIQLSQQEMAHWLIAVRPALVEASEKKLLPAPGATDIVDAPSLGVAHKLKLTLPIVPFLLGYEGEVQLGSRMNLEMAWEWLKNKLSRS